MDIKTKGIVLHTVKYSETSVIVKIYTEKLGLVSYIVNGVRSSKSTAKASMMRPLTLLDLDTTHRENKGLQRIKEFRRAYTYKSIPFDTMKSAIAIFILEVVTKSLKEHDANEDMFHFVYDCFVHLDEMEVMNNDFHLQFLVHYTVYLGFPPQGEYSDSTPYFDMQEGVFTPKSSISSLVLNKQQSEYISLLSSSNMLQPLDIKLHRGHRQELLHHLLKYYNMHLEGFAGLRSPEVLEVLFS
ncbi:MAG: repair protein recO [Bacteroidetes bacterium]|nr:repair protein recO [Bacteroidota bacterium]